MSKTFLSCQLALLPFSAVSVMAAAAVVAMVVVLAAWHKLESSGKRELN